MTRKGPRAAEPAEVEAGGRFGEYSVDACGIEFAISVLERREHGGARQVAAGAVRAKRQLAVVVRPEDQEDLAGHVPSGVEGQRDCQLSEPIIRGLAEEFFQRDALRPDEQRFFR